MIQLTIFDLLLIGLSMGIVIGLIIDTTIHLMLGFCINKQDDISKLFVITYFQIAAFILRKKVVMVKNQAGVVLTLAQCSPINNEDLIGYHNYKNKTLPLLLKPDGKVNLLTTNWLFKSYAWLPYDLEERTFMVLQGADNFSY